MNIYACLVHESPECALDLVRNLRHLDPESQVLLYDGGARREILECGQPFNAYGAVLHPAPRGQVWGRLHGFALDCMRFALEHWKFETLTIVDSDQLGTRTGYSGHLQNHLAGQTAVGLLGNSPGVMKVAGEIGPVRCALAEAGLWRSFLRRFAGGEEKFPHWTFWPSTVFTSGAARELVDLFAKDRELQAILANTKIFATEEIFFPTVAALLGYEVAANPCSYDYVQFRVPYTVHHADLALSRHDVFWMHSVPRQINHPLRRHLREKLYQYGNAELRNASPGSVSFGTASPGSSSLRAASPGTAALPAAMTESVPVVAATPAPPQSGGLVLSLPILQRVRGIRGWLQDGEADLLISAVSRALLLPRANDAHRQGAIVEVGSFEGKATLVLASVVKAMRADAKVYAIDPHDGKVGALDGKLTQYPRTQEALVRNLAGAGLRDHVEVIARISSQVTWDKPIAFLLIDHLHDYASVSGDFEKFAGWVVPGGYVAFHDYADYFPGVKRLVDELLDHGGYREAACVHSMIVLERVVCTAKEQACPDSLPQAMPLGAPDPLQLPVAAAPPLVEVVSSPLVSCLMPTADRRLFAAQAIRHFLRQDYENRELIIVDDGEDNIVDLVPDHPRIRYLRLPERLTIGAKHNLACKLAHGDIMVHWDDDDWMADRRLTYQVSELLQQPAMTLSGLARMLFYEPSSGRAWEYAYTMRTPKWVGGGTFCYRREFWNSHPFPDMNEGGDTVFAWNLRQAHVSALADHTFYVATVHGHNTSIKRTGSAGWQPIASRSIERLLDQQSWAFYRDAARWSASSDALATVRRNAAPSSASTA
jgi:hypothetical protein